MGANDVDQRSTTCTACCEAQRRSEGSASLPSQFIFSVVLTSGCISSLNGRICGLGSWFSGSQQSLFRGLLVLSHLISLVILVLVAIRCCRCRCCNHGIFCSSSKLVAGAAAKTMASSAAATWSPASLLQP
jgi:hypothetical protein